MQNDVNKKQLFYEYYHQWIEVYKRGAIREATMAKYLMTLKWVKKTCSGPAGGRTYPYNVSETA